VVGCVGADRASIHRRGGADLTIDATAFVGGPVARASTADGAAVLNIQRGQIVDTATVEGIVGTNGAAIHRRRAGRVVDAAAEGCCYVALAGPADGAAVLDGQRGQVVDTAAVAGGCVGADGAAIHRRRAKHIVDAATFVAGRVARAGPTYSAAVLDGQRGCGALIVDAAAVGGPVVADGAAIHRHCAGHIEDAAAVNADRVVTYDAATHCHRADRVVDTAAVGGRVVADGATIHRRRAGRVVDTTTANGRVSRAGPADCAALDIQRALVEDTAAAAGDAAIADGHTVQSDRVGAAAAGTDVKHPVYPTAVNDRIRCAVALDSQIAAIQDIQVSARIGLFARCPRKDNGDPVNRSVKGDDVGARVVIGIGDGLTQGTWPAVIGAVHNPCSSPDRLRGDTHKQCAQ